MLKNLNTGPVSAAKYLKSGRARKLPLYQCYMTRDWEVKGKFPVLVSRKHSNGNLTAAILLIDILCTGVKDAFFLFNQPEDDFREVIDSYAEMGEELQLFDYELVHNVIFGALEFAEDFGIKPHQDFALTSMILEKDDDNIPLMKIPLGDDEEPVLIYSYDDPKADYYLRQLKAHAGEGNFQLIIDEGLDEDDDSEFTDDESDMIDFMDWQAEDWKEFLQEVNTEDISPIDPIFRHIFEKLEYRLKLKAGEFDDLKLPEEIEIEYADMPEDEQLEEAEVQEKIKSFGNLRRESTAEEIEEAISDLKEAISQWPNYPRFYDFLTAAYIATENIAKAEEVNREQRLLFPHDFFGKLSQAKLLLNADRLDEIEDALGGLSPGTVFSGLKKVNIIEVTSLLKILSSYWLEQGDLPRAFHLVLMIHEVDPEEIEELTVEDYIMMVAHVVGRVNILIEEMRANSDKLERAAAILGNDGNLVAIT